MLLLGHLREVPGIGRFIAMKTMRLLAVTTSYPLREDASAGIFVQRLYEHLPQDWDVTVVCPDDDARVAVDDAVKRVKLRPYRYAPRRWQTLSQQAGGIMPSLRKQPIRFLLIPWFLSGMFIQCALQAGRADLIHANWSISGLVAGLVGRLSRRPVVTTLRGDDVSNAGRGSRLHRWILSGAVRSSQRIICVSSAMAAVLRDQYPQDSHKVLVCHNGVEEEFLRVKPQGAQAGRLRILAVGSLVRRKGFDILIRAVANSASKSGMHLTIAGSGPELAALTSQAAGCGLSRQVEFVGELPPQNVAGFLATGDVLAMSSRSEGRPNSVVEALAAGLPVISTALPGIEGLVESGVNGWVVPIGDDVAMTRALDSALIDPVKRAAMGRNARARILALNETWEGTGRAYDGVFRCVIDEFNRTRA